ncbi:MAG: PQQ-binding-like beta-propeller repeat protein [Oligoflexales bacterium]
MSSDIQSLTVEHHPAKSQKRTALTYFSLLLLTGLSSSCNEAKRLPYHAGYELKRSQSEIESGYLKNYKPFRTSFFKLAPDLDKEKPLAVADYGGWLESNGILLGSLDDDWLTGLTLPGLGPKWWRKSPGAQTCPPVSFGSWAVFGFRNGSIWKINALTGDKVWERKLDSFPARRIKKTENQLLVVTAKQTIYAIDSESGTVNWVHDSNASEGLSIRNLAAPTVHQEQVYYGLSSGEVVALDLKTGERKWTHNPGFSEARFHDMIGEIYIIGNGKGLLLTRYDGIMTAVNLNNPKQNMWEPVKLNSITDSSFRHNRVYVGTHSGYVYAYNPDNGKQLWQSHIGASVGSITAGETKLYVTSTQGRIAALDVEGKMLWHDQLEGLVTGSPVYIGNNIFFQTGLRNFYGYSF